jgi:hypothetical protein
MRAVLATFMLAGLFAATAPAQTAPLRHNHPNLRQVAHHRVEERRIALVHHRLNLKLARVHHLRFSGMIHHMKMQVVRWLRPDARPAHWCGWFMRQVFHIADREYNRAAHWAQWGHWSPGPRVGAVVVWWHHVGLIEGGPDKRGQWLVRSGNDANMVRTRYMSLARAIAFRMP